MRRLLIVSNRLPINIKKNGDDSNWSFQVSSGGLVSALQGLQKSTSFIWIGWPGLQVDEEQHKLFSDTLFKQYSALPVFIDEKTSELHYNGFSNSTIWPLFHYLPGDIDFNNDQWLGYVRANELFAEKIINLVEDGDCIWVHDYHLMMLPKMLRERCNKTVSIGFFLHIPFPASDVYRAMPYRREILEGLLASDLVGFHIYDYARHFIASCTRILGVNASPSSVEYKDRVVKIGAYPVGIEPEKFLQCLNDPDTVVKMEDLKAKFNGLKVIVGVERLDYIKGLTQKLLAFEAFLEQNSEFRGKVVLLQIAIPSRGDVEEYQNLQNQVFELIGRINGKFSTLDYSPVQFIHNSVNFQELVALYRLGDVCLITSTRDGMNLVAYEYIASQKQKCGTLILSEFVGAAQSLNGSILINPWSISDITNALITALNMNSEERAVMHSHLYSYVEKFTAARWGTSFVEDLIEVSQLSSKYPSIQKFTSESITQFKSKKILIIVEKDQVNEADLSQILTMLQDNSCHIILAVHIIDSSEDLPAVKESTHAIILNYGSNFYSQALRNWMTPLLSIQSFAVPDHLMNILHYYHDRCPGSRIIVDQSMIIWDFSYSENSVGEWTSCELQINLEKLIGHQPLKVIRDGKCIIISDASFDFETIQTTIMAIAEQSGADVILAKANSPLLQKGIAKLKSNCTVFKL